MSGTSWEGRAPPERARRAARLGLVVCLGLAACHASQPLELPEAEIDVETTLLVIAGVEQDEVWAFAGGPAALPVFSAPRTGSLLLLLYDRPPEALGLTPGRVALAPPGEARRPLPVPQVGLRAQREEGGVGPWRPLSPNDEIFARLGRPALPLAACLESGGCYERPEDFVPRICGAGCAARESPAAVNPVAPPARIDFTPCLPGWGPVSESGVTFCAPPPAPSCAEDEAAWPSAPTCQRLGPECPSPIEFAPDLPADREIVYVRPGAQGGDGTIFAPLGDVQAAIQAAPEGAVIALATGTYAGPLLGGRGVTFWGACVAGTRVEAEGSVAVRVFGPDSGVRNLTVAGRSGGLAVIGGGSRAHVEDVVFEGHEQGPAIAVATASVTLHRVRVRGTVAVPTPALEVRGRGEVRASQVMFDDNGGYTVLVENQASVVGIDDGWLVAPTRRFRTDGALYARAGGTIEARGVVVSAYRARAARVEGAGSRLELQQVVLRDVVEPDDGATAIEVGPEGRVELSRVTVEQIEGPAIRTSGEVVGDQLYARASAAQREGHVLVEGGTLDVSRAGLVDAPGYGVAAIGGQVGLRDVQIARITRSVARPRPNAAVGLWLRDGARIEAARVSIVDVASHGLVATSTMSAVPVSGRIEDLHIAQVDDQVSLSGHAAYFRAEVRDLTLERVSIDEVANSAIDLGETAQLTLLDYAVSRARFGLRITEAAQVTATRSSMSFTRGGAVCMRLTAELTARDLSIDRVIGLDASDGNTVCGGGMRAAGDGILVNDLGRLDLARYEIRGSVAVGLRSRGAQTVSAADGFVHDNAVGLQLAPGTPPESALVRTVVRDNDVDIIEPP